MINRSKGILMRNIEGKFFVLRCSMRVEFYCVHSQLNYSLFNPRSFDKIFILLRRICSSLTYYWGKQRGKLYFLAHSKISQKFSSQHHKNQNPEWFFLAFSVHDIQLVWLNASRQLVWLKRFFRDLNHYSGWNSGTPFTDSWLHNAKHWIEAKRIILKKRKFIRKDVQVV